MHTYSLIILPHVHMHIMCAIFVINAQHGQGVLDSCRIICIQDHWSEKPKLQQLLPPLLISTINQVFRFTRPILLLGVFTPYSYTFMRLSQKIHNSICNAELSWTLAVVAYDNQIPSIPPTSYMSDFSSPSPVRTQPTTESYLSIRYRRGWHICFLSHAPFHAKHFRISWAEFS